MGREVNIGLIQTSCGDDVHVNLQKALDYIEAAAQEGAQVICLQELFRSHYPCQTEDHSLFGLAESVPGHTTQALCDKAAKHEVVVVGSVFEKRAAGLYHNTAVVIDADGKLLGSYRKMHIPDDPGYQEKFYFTPGDGGFKCFDTRYCRLGVLVCWDQWFPEAARLVALKGAEVILYPTAIGWAVDHDEDLGMAERQAWELSMRAHAVANGVYVAAVNRVGVEGTTQFWGSSFVADVLGCVIEKASEDEEELIIVGCDLERIDEIRCQWPFLRDRRIDAYDGLRARYLGAH